VPRFLVRLFAALAEQIRMNIEYKINKPITSEQFVELLEKSSLAERRPIHNSECMEGVVKNSNLVVSAWHGDELIGIARSVTDFHYACYLSDLAVDQKYQKSGVGKRLMALTQEQLNEECNLTKNRKSPGSAGETVEV